MNLQFSLKILESNNIIGARIAYALIPPINKYVRSIHSKIKPIISNIVVDSIISEPEYDSLMSGELKGEFGIPDPSSRLSEILDTIRSGANVVMKATSVTNNRVTGGVRFQMIRSDFQDLLSLGSASFVTEKGSQLNWLRWLLIEGDNVIINEYGFVGGPSPYSRTGLGIMRKFNGAFWRVPPEFAGTIKNNWITRAIDKASSEINKALTDLAKG